MVTKKKYSGGRYSRVVTTTYSPESMKPKAIKAFLDEMLSERGRRDGKGGYVLGRNFSDYIQAWAERAAAFLRSRKLPDAPVLFWTKVSPDNWQAEPPARENIKRYCILEQYILKDRGFDRDSPEGLAARIITTVQYIQHLDGEPQLQQAFMLGEIYALAITYHMLDIQQRKPKPKRKPWLQRLARDLVAKDRESTAAKLWRDLPDNEDETLEQDGLDIYRKSDDLVCFNGSGYESIKERAFRRYIRDAKQEASEK